MSHTGSVEFVESGYGKGWPRVAGECPSCHCKSLFLALGGWVTCALPSCPNPTAVSDLLDPPLLAFTRKRA